VSRGAPRSRFWWRVGASTTVTASTLPSRDTTPPSAPTLDVYAVDSCEVFAQWTASSDNQSEPAEIRYLLFVNDDPNPTEVVMGITRTVAYGNATGDNTFVLKAIDAGGNVSVSNPGDTAVVVLRATAGAAATAAPDFASTIASAYKRAGDTLKPAQR